MQSPLVSIIITTKNEADIIERLLRSIKEQFYKKVEIIVVDNGSNDKTKKIVKSFTKKLYDKGPERSAQRNFGARKAVGKYLFFLDADMQLTPRVVEMCVKKIKENKKIACIEIPEESVAYSFWERVKAYERSFYNEKGDPITDAARFFKKDVFNKAGGYDETITGPEDWDLTETIRKLGYKIDRIFEKIYHHERLPSLVSLFRKKFYYGLHAHKYLAKHHIAILSPKTIYFLRPFFYKRWRQLLSNPLLSGGMIIMFITQMIGGGLGYLIGRLKRL